MGLQQQTGAARTAVETAHEKSMQIPHSNVRYLRAHQYVRFAGWFAIVIGALVIIGWLADAELLRSLFRGQVAMKFNAAICLTLAGSTLLSLRRWSGTHPVPVAIRVSLRLTAALVALMGLTATGEWLFRWDFGIDQLFFTEITTAPHPGRMVLLTAIAFTCIGSSELLLYRGSAKSLAAQLLALLANGVALVGVLDVLLTLETSATGIAVHTAFALWILSFALLLAEPDQGFVKVLFSDGSGGVMARRLLVPAVAVPIVLGALRWWGSQAGLYSQEVGLEILVSAMVLLFIGIIFWTALKLEGVDVERKRAESIALERKRRLDLAQKAGRLGAYDWTIATNEIIWTPELESLYGLPEGGFDGKYEAWKRAVHPEDFERAEKELLQAVRTKSDFDSEFRIVWPDQSTHWVAARGSLVLDEFGQPLRLVGINVDITDRKRSEEEIRHLNEGLEMRVQERTAELEAVNKELESFTYSAAHDLRAPLRQIDGFSKILLEEFGPQLDSTAQKYLWRVREGAGIMRQLVDDLLNLARLGRRELQLQNADVKTLTEEVVAELQPEIANRRVEWKISSFPPVQCDPALLKIILTNLLSNAVKFTRPRELAVIEVGSTEQNGQSVIHVRDNGVGFDMNYADKLFGVFQRLHHPQEFEGTGVGLATVQRIVHKHGGRIWANSELNNGANFYFTLGTHKTE